MEHDHLCASESHMAIIPHMHILPPLKHYSPTVCCHVSLSLVDMNAMASNKLSLIIVCGARREK